jgi:hypothetical protein
MQNKPNSRKPKTNATPFVTRNYESKPPLATRRKRTQSNPIEPNFKIGKINISTAKTKAYINEQRTMSNERYSKQTQTNPKLELCSTLSEVEGPIKPNSPAARESGGGRQGRKKHIFSEIP